MDIGFGRGRARNRPPGSLVGKLEEIAMNSPASVAPLHPVLEFFAVPFRPRTYGSVIYLWLGFPLGLAYFIALTVGFSLGIPLVILWVGLFVLFLTLSLAWAAEGLERQLANRLLGAEVPARLDESKVAVGKRFARLRAIAKSPALWKGMIFLLLKFPLGVAGWVFSLVALIVPIAFLVAPFALLFDHGGVHFGFWEPVTFWGALPLSIVGLLGLFVSLHLHNLLGKGWARLAEWLLGDTVPGETSTPAPETGAAVA
jgi:hypothetical protein